MITTSEFEIPGSKMVLSLAMTYGKWWLVGDAALVAVLAVVSILTADLRFAILALMLVLIITPMMAAMLYIMHGTKRFNALNSLPHTVEFGKGKLTITMKPCRDAGKDEELDEQTREEDVSALRDIEVGYADVHSLAISDSIMHISIKTEGALLIPLTAFAGQQDAIAALELMRPYTAKTQK